MTDDLPDLYYKVDIDPRIPRQFRYHRAALGIAPRPTEMYLQLTHLDADAVVEAIDHAVDMIMLARDHNIHELRKMDEWERPWDILKEVAETDIDHVRLMSAAITEAQRDTRYWGIDDPTKESYCSTCKSPKPVSYFQDSPNICKECYDAR